MNLLEVSCIISNIHNPITPTHNGSGLTSKESDNGWIIYSLGNVKSEKFGNFNSYFKEEIRKEKVDGKIENVPHTFFKGSFPDYMLREFKGYNITFA